MVRRSSLHAPWLLIGVALFAAFCGLFLQWLRTNHVASRQQAPPHTNGATEAGQNNGQQQPKTLFEPVVLKTTRDQNPDGGNIVAGGLRVDLSFRAEPDDYGGEWLVPLLLIRSTADATAGDLLTRVPLISHVGQPATFGDAMVQIVELDRSNGKPEVLFAQHSGGAHCCALLTIFRADDGGDWTAIDVGAFDGPTFVATKPLPTLDPDYVLVTRDNRFLGRFSSYAASSPPPQFLALVNGTVQDVSDRPGLRPLFLEDAERQAEELTLRADVGNGEINGLLAGYAASHARAGLIDTAWPVVLDRYDATSTWGLVDCLGDYDSEGNCQGKLTRYPGFPEALAIFLQGTGYVTENLVGHMH